MARQQAMLTSSVCEKACTGHIEGRKNSSNPKAFGDSPCHFKNRKDLKLWSVLVQANRCG